jgi:imidazole glycerol phosphate synthase subunit HisF
MEAYLKQMSSIDGVRTFCFVTQGLPFAWMGGNRSANQMKALCEAKGAKVVQTGVINRSSIRRDQKIEKLAKTFCDQSV